MPYVCSSRIWTPFFVGMEGQILRRVEITTGNLLQLNAHQGLLISMRKHDAAALLPNDIRSGVVARGQFSNLRQMVAAGFSGWRGGLYSLRT